MQIKVTSTKQHKIYDWKCTHNLCYGNEDKCTRNDCESIGKWIEIPVTEAKLVLVDITESEVFNGFKHYINLPNQYTSVKPILISKTEKIEEGEFQYKKQPLLKSKVEAVQISDLFLKSWKTIMQILMH